jgi:3-dehydroquinate synthase
LEGPAAVARIEKHLEALSQTTHGTVEWQSVLKDIVTDSLLIKKAYIEKDEFDQGVRNILNYGHTFGHAYESATHYAIPHGIAVMLGILTATWVSADRDLIPRSHFDELDRLLKPYYTPFEKQLATLSDRALITSALQTDKKNTAGRVGCILTRGFGKMERMPLDFETELKQPLFSFLDWTRTC